MAKYSFVFKGDNSKTKYWYDDEQNKEKSRFDQPSPNEFNDKPASTVNFQPLPINQTTDFGTQATLLNNPTANSIAINPDRTQRNFMIDKAIQPEIDALTKSGLKPDVARQNALRRLQGGIPNIPDYQLNPVLENTKPIDRGFISNLPENAANIGKNVAKSFIETAAGIPQSLGILSSNLKSGIAPSYAMGTETPRLATQEEIDANPLYRAGRGLSNIAQSIRTDPNKDKSFITGTIPQAFGSQLAFYLTGGLSKAMGMSAGAGAALTGALSQGANGYQEAMQYTNDPRKLYTAFLVNTGIGTSEALPIADMFGELDKYSGGAVNKGFKKLIGNLALGAKEGTEEFVQEFGQQIASDLSAKAIYDSSRDIYKSIGQGFEGGAAGFATGFLATLIGIKIKNKNLSQPEKQYLKDAAQNLQIVPEPNKESSSEQVPPKPKFKEVPKLTNEQLTQDINKTAPTEKVGFRPYKQTEVAPQILPITGATQQDLENKPLTPVQKRLIENQVKKLGNIEAVNKQYTDNNITSAYAKEYAQKQYPETPETILGNKYNHVVDVLTKNPQATTSDLLTAIGRRFNKKSEQAIEQLRTKLQPRPIETEQVKPEEAAKVSPQTLDEQFVNVNEMIKQPKNQFTDAGKMVDQVGGADKKVEQKPRATKQQQVLEKINSFNIDEFNRNYDFANNSKPQYTKDRLLANYGEGLKDAKGKLIKNYTLQEIQQAYPEVSDYEKLAPKNNAKIILDINKDGKVIQQSTNQTGVTNGKEGNQKGNQEVLNAKPEPASGVAPNNTPTGTTTPEIRQTTPDKVEKQPSMVTGTNVSKFGEVPSPQKTTMSNAPKGFYQNVTVGQTKKPAIKVLSLGEERKSTNTYLGRDKIAKGKADLDLELMDKFGFTNPNPDVKNIVDRVFNGEKIESVLADYPDLAEKYGKKGITSAEGVKVPSLSPIAQKSSPKNTDFGTAPKINSEKQNTIMDESPINPTVVAETVLSKKYSNNNADFNKVVDDFAARAEHLYQNNKKFKERVQKGDKEYLGNIFDLWADGINKDKTKTLNWVNNYKTNEEQPKPTVAKKTVVAKPAKTWQHAVIQFVQSGGKFSPKDILGSEREGMGLSFRNFSSTAQPTLDTFIDNMGYDFPSDQSQSEAVKDVLRKHNSSGKRKAFLAQMETNIPELPESSIKQLDQEIADNEALDNIILDEYLDADSNFRFDDIEQNANDIIKRAGVSKESFNRYVESKRNAEIALENFDFSNAMDDIFGTIDNAINKGAIDERSIEKTITDTGRKAKGQRNNTATNEAPNSTESKEGGNQTQEVKPQVLKQNTEDRKQLQDRKRHLELVIENDKSTPAQRTDAKRELIDIGKKLNKVNTEANQFDMFGDAQDQISLFRKEADRTRNVFNKMNETERTKAMNIIANSFLEENPDIGFSNLAKEKAAAITYISNGIANAMRFDPRTADILSFVHEANHAALVNLLPSIQAIKILQENGWDGKGDHKQPNSNSSLENAYEKLAEANEKWYSDTKIPTKKMTSQFIQTMKNLWAKLAAFLHRNGLYTQAGFFENLYTGRLKEMAAREQTERINEITAESALAQKKSITDTPELKKWFSQTAQDAIKKFGTTEDINQAGFILPDGTLLDFKNDFKRIQHAEIENISKDKSKKLADFIKGGAVRIQKRSGIIETNAYPTERQKDIIIDALLNHVGSFYVDVLDPVSNTKESIVLRPDLGYRKAVNRFYNALSNSGAFDPNNPNILAQKLDKELPESGQQLFQKLPDTELNDLVSVGNAELNYQKKQGVPEAELYNKWKAGMIEIGEDMIDEQDIDKLWEAMGQKIPEQPKTGIKNAVVNAERELRKLDPIEKEASRGREQVWEEAKALINSGAINPRDFVQSLKEKPRAVSDLEDAIIAHDRVTLNNERDTVSDQLLKAVQAKDQNAEFDAALRLERINQDIADNDLVADKVGTEQARGLAFRRWLYNNDYSLAAVERKMNVARSGQPIPDNMRQEMESLVKQYEEKQKVLEDRLKLVEERNSKLEAEKLVKEIERKIEYDNRRARRARTSVELSKERTDLYKELFDTVNALNANPFANVKAATTLAKIARNYIETGINSAEGIVDAIYNDVKDKFDGITKRDIRDALTGYGQDKPDKKANELAEKLRNVKQQLTLISKIEDAQSGKRPFKARFEKKAPDETIAGLRKQLNDLIKEKGLKEEISDAKKLEAYKKRIATQKADLERAIKSGNLEKVKKEPLPLDAEAIQAKAELTQVQKKIQRMIDMEKWANRTWSQKAKDTFTELINLPRSAFLTVMDFSAPLRQGLILGARRPIMTATKVFPEAFKAMFKPKIYDAIEAKIALSPNKKYYDRFGLEITEAHGEPFNLGKREEIFMSTIAERIPIWGKVVQASERGFTAYMNLLRTSSFDSIIDGFTKNGYDINDVKNDKLYTDLAKFVNMASLRGDMGKKLNNAAPLLNGIIFSPRNLYSRVQLLNPVYYMKMAKPARIEALKTMFSMVGSGMVILALAKAMGADVEDEPTSTDFGKIKIGNTRLDIWGGFQQFARFGAVMAKGEFKSTTGKTWSLDGKTYPFINRYDISLKFLENKLSPQASLLISALKGKTATGQEFNLSDEVINRMLPLALSDSYEAINELGWTGVPFAGLGFLGAGVQTFKPKTTLQRILDSRGDAPKRN